MRVGTRPELLQLLGEVHGAWRAEPPSGELRAGPVAHGDEDDGRSKDAPDIHDRYAACGTCLVMRACSLSTFISQDSTMNDDLTEITDEQVNFTAFAGLSGRFDLGGSR